MIDPRLVADATAAEGRRLTAYKDTLGFWTAGVGHKLPVGPDYTNITYTPAQCDAWLAADLDAAEAQAATLGEWTQLDTACRCNAVVELVFNMGISHWEGFHQTRYAIQIQHWQLAHDQLLDSAWAKQVGPARSNRLANYLLTGCYP